MNNMHDYLQTQKDLLERMTVEQQKTFLQETLLTINKTQAKGFENLDIETEFSYEKVNEDFATESPTQHKQSNNKINISSEEVSLEQGSVKWLNTRRKYVSASMIPSIFGFNYNGESLIAHIIEKVYGINIMTFSSSQKSSMKGGLDNENPILKAHENQLMSSFHPTVFKAKDKRLLASLDGYSSGLLEVLETKACNNELYKNIENYATIPIHFYLQIQAQLLISNSNRAMCICTKTVMGGYKSAHKVPILRNETVMNIILRASEFILNVIDELKKNEYSPKQVQQMIQSKIGIFKDLNINTQSFYNELIKDAEVQKSLQIPCIQTKNRSTAITNKNFLLDEYKMLQEQSSNFYSKYKTVKDKMENMRLQFSEYAGHFIGETGNSIYKLSSEIELHRDHIRYISTAKMQTELERLYREKNESFNINNFKTDRYQLSVKKTFTPYSKQKSYSRN